MLQVRSDGVRVLSFWFPVPGASDCPRDASRAYVLSLIDDRWPGALAARLEALGWIDNQSVEATRDTSFTRIGYLLTPEGMHHVPEIGLLLFDYLRLIGNRGVDPGRLAQWRAGAALLRRYADAPLPLDPRFGRAAAP